MPRFAVAQGLRADGTTKLRAVDHFSWSAPPADRKRKRSRNEVKEDSINGHYEMPVAVSHEHLDQDKFGLAK